METGVKLRDYQERLFVKCCRQNVIICLPTGSGKTMIAIRVIIQLLKETVGTYPGEARRTFFLAPKRALAVQQFQVIKELVPATVMLITGDDEPDKFDRAEWTKRLAQNQVFVVTPDILSDILQKGYIRIAQLNLLIIDEMHWAFRDGVKTSGHPYSRIMSIFREQMADVPVDEQPRVIAMSASLFISHNNNIIGNLEWALSQIEKLYQAKIEAGGFSYANKFQEEIVPYQDRPVDILGTLAFRFDFSRLLELFSNFKTVSYLNQFRLAFQKLQSLLETEMGPWFALQFATICCQSLKKNIRSKLSETMLKVFVHIIRCIKRSLLLKPNQDCLWLQTTLISDKLRVLFQLLTGRLRPMLESDNFTCILFVDERIDGNLVFRWLEFLSQKDEKLRFLKPAFICGTFQKDFIQFDQQHRKDFLEDMKTKKLNLVVATSILEEGIDIPVCNVVIRYDGVPNFRAYCQSRGRARDDKSLYFIMTEQREIASMNKKLVNFRQMDALLANIKSPEYVKIFELPNPDYDDYTEDSAADDGVEDRLFHSIPPYRHGNSVLYPSASTALLNRYLMKLPRDLFTEQRMPWVMFQKSNRISSKPRYAFALVFPINSKHTGIVVKGPYFERRKYASACCSFRACIYLIEQGDIDPDLNVYRPEFILSQHAEELSIREMANTMPHYKPEGKYATRVYENRQSNFLRSLKKPAANVDGHSSRTYFLYSVVFRGRFPSTTKNAELAQQQFKPLFLAPNDSVPPETIGILLTQPYSLEMIQSYIYFNLYPIKFELKFCQQIDLDVETTGKVQRFHEHVMMTIFRKMFPTAEQEDSGVSFDFGAMIVPLVQRSESAVYVVDFAKMDAVHDWLKQRIDCLENGKLSPDNLTVDKLRNYDPNTDRMTEDNRFTLFTLVHHTDLRLYYVKNFTDVRCTELMRQPCKDYPDGVTYEQYFQEKYQRQLTQRDMPMINASLVEKVQLNYFLYRSKCTVLKSTSGTDASAEQPKNAILFPLELMTVYPLSSAMYLQIASLPMVFYRLEQHCLGSEFLKMLSDKYFSMNPIKEKFDVDEILLKSRKSTRETVFDEETDEEIEHKPVQLIGLEQIVNLQSSVENVTQDSCAQEAFETFLNELNKDDGQKQPITPAGDEYFGVEEVEKLLQPNFEEKLFEELSKAIQDFLASHTDKNKRFRPINWSPDEHQLEFGDVSMYRFTGDIDTFIQKDGMVFNTFQKFDSPHPWQIVQGLTLSKANDSWNIERLETIGDSFIKFTVSLYLFFRYTDYDEKRFNILKSALLNNRNLFCIALERNLTEFIFSSLERNIPFNLFKKLMLRDDCAAASAATTEEKRPSLRYKDVADVVESIIGAFLVYGGAGSAIRFLNDFLDLKAFDPNAILENKGHFFDKFFQDKLNLQLKVIGGDPAIFGQQFEFIDDNDICNQLLNRCQAENLKQQTDDIYRFNCMHLLEEEIDYHFENKFLLVQALTHPSMSRSVDPRTGEFIYNFIPSYQRLEFIGDACLDLLVTHYIYLRDSTLNPTEITVLRSALVNNAFYGSVAVKYGLHRYIRHNSFGLQDKILEFVKLFSYKYLSQMENMIVLGEEQFCSNDLDQAEVPKTLADIFEALIGAIFVDCHFDLDRVWRVVYKMIKVELDHFMVKVPLMPVYRLHLQYWDKYHWSQLEELVEVEGHPYEDNKRFAVATNRGIQKKIQLTVDGFGEDMQFIGYGTSKRKCKLAAARKFFAWLEEFEKKKGSPSPTSNVPLA